MRRKALLLAALPAASAISFANFQPLSFNMVPPFCETPYYAQIPGCTASDFHNGCSQQCESALEAMAQGVIRACSHAPAPPNSLLAAILEGAIVASVCPPEASPPPTSTPAAVTVPMESPSVQVSMTPPATPQAQPTTPPVAPPPPPPATTSSSPTPKAQSSPTATLEGVTRVSICASYVETPPAPTNPVETNPAHGGIPLPGSMESSTESSTSAATPTAAANAGEGGSGNPGAPFQLVGGNVDEVAAANMLRGSSVLALVVAALACILL